MHPGTSPSDLARAWWQWGRPERTTHEALSTLGVSPGEVHHRPVIRHIVTDLHTRRLRVTGVREPATATAV